MAEEVQVAAEVKPAVRKKTIFDLMETDANVETMGILMHYGEDITILVARAGGANKKFERVLKDLTKAHRNTIKAGTVEDEVVNSVLQEAYAKAVVLGWDGITERDGTPIECTPDNVVKLFKQLPQLWADIREFAANYPNFLTVEEDAEDVAKN